MPVAIGHHRALLRYASALGLVGAVLLHAGGTQAQDTEPAAPRYLNWHNKTTDHGVYDQPLPTRPADIYPAQPRKPPARAVVTSSAPSGHTYGAVSEPVPPVYTQPVETAYGPATYYGVPPSPYGQVGAQVTTTRPQPSRERNVPVPPAPVRTTAPAPVANYYVTPYVPAAPPPPPPPAAPVHTQVRSAPPAERHTAAAAVVQQANQTHISAPPPVPAPTPEPSSPPQDSIEARGGYTASGYQVPASSPYARRIASARATQAQPVAQPQATEASAPPPGPPLSEDATSAYIPAEAMTASAAANEPRYYSLHRQYGLEPDPIPPSAPSQGALLVPSNLMEDWDADAQTQEDDQLQKQGLANGIRPTE